MNIHEYQAKALFEKNGIPVPKGYVAFSGIEAEFAMKRLGVEKAVVKAQIHAGGRGKAGGVKLVSSSYECRTTAESLLGSTLVTHQTGPQGKEVKKVYIEACTDIDKEYYLALLVDRETANIAIMFSSEGGMDIETVAKESPEKIVTVKVDPTLGIRSFHIQQLCTGLKLSKAEATQAAPLIKDLYNLFIKYDCSLLEINPLVLNSTGKFIAIDGKMNFDDNALYRHPDISLLRDFDEEDIREIEASKFDLNYIGLDGNIGCLVNGAGLAMATMDIIKYYGGSPANFLDVGGGASEEMVTQAFKIILQDLNVKAVFVNIFGGIMKCDVVANGLVNAAKALKIQVPLIVRLEGTNVELGREILSKAGLDIITADDMADGAQKAVKAAAGNIK